MPDLTGERQLGEIRSEDEQEDSDDREIGTQVQKIEEGLAALKENSSWPLSRQEKLIEEICTFAVLIGASFKSNKQQQHQGLRKIDGLYSQVKADQDGNKQAINSNQNEMGEVSTRVRLLGAGVAREGSLIIRKLLDSGAIAMFNLFHTIYPVEEDGKSKSPAKGFSSVAEKGYLQGWEWNTFRTQLTRHYGTFHTVYTVKQRQSDRQYLLYQTKPLLSPEELAPEDRTLLSEHILTRFEKLEVGDLTLDDRDPQHPGKKLWISDRVIESDHLYIRRQTRFFLCRFIWEFNTRKRHIAESDRIAQDVWDSYEISRSSRPEEFLQIAIDRLRTDEKRRARQMQESGTGSVDQTWSVARVLKELMKMRESNTRHKDRFSKGTASSARALHWFSSTLPGGNARPSDHGINATGQRAGQSDASARPKRPRQERDHPSERPSNIRKLQESEGLIYDGEGPNLTSLRQTAADNLVRHLDARTQGIAKFEKVRQGLSIVLDSSVLDQVLDKDSALRALANDVAHMNEAVKPVSKEIYEAIENNVGQLFDALLPEEFAEERKPKGNKLKETQEAVKSLVQTFGRQTPSGDEILESYDSGTTKIEERIDEYVNQEVNSLEAAQVGAEGEFKQKYTDVYKLLRLFDKINPIIDN